MASYLLSLAVLALALEQVTADLVLDDGYEVSTLLDGHKHSINPYSVQPHSGSSDLIVLDSSESAFYTLSFPSSHESVIQHISGNGAGFSDGELNLAKFDRPKSFAVGPMGHVYVADKANQCIRKITHSGVTTIAGGASHKIGNIDGPAQNASFSSDLELVFLPERCALLITDRGNQLLRLINLKDEDCKNPKKLTLSLHDFFSLAILVVVFGILLLLILVYIGKGKDKVESLNSQCGEDSGVVCPQSRSATSRTSVSSRMGAALNRLAVLVTAHLSLILRLGNGVSAVRDEPVKPLHEDEQSCIRDLISFEDPKNEDGFTKV